jgi:halimadienyl-diphosphate synthase
MLDNLHTTLQARDHLSSSIYDIAACALLEGPAQSVCLHWLIDTYDKFGYWGENLSWQDRYLCTYSAAIAMLVGGQTALAREALAALPKIPKCYPDNRTANFGGLIAAVDAYAERRLKFGFNHPAVVQKVIEYDYAKWRSIVHHEMFYDPRISTAGFFAEWCYLIPQIDPVRILDSFQVDNGSISNSPGASAFCLLSCEEVGLLTPQVTDLRQYIDQVNPYQREIGILDQAPNFVTAWALLFMDQPQLADTPEFEAIQSLRKAVARPKTMLSICAGSTTFPGDMDTTACALIGLNLPYKDRQHIMQSFDDMFETDHYLTFSYERTPSVTTNVHAVAAWPENPKTSAILEWIEWQIAAANGFPICKWHCSPYYSLSEIGRLFAEIDHSVARRLAHQAGMTLLKTQDYAGGWGWQGVTCEETSYAILALEKLRDHGLIDHANATGAISRAKQFLTKQPPDYRSLWIGKSLYHVKPLERWLRSLALGIESDRVEKSLSVLYIDDSPAYRTIFKAIMDEYDLDAVMVGDAETAFSYLDANTPDVVVVDLRMPGIDGFEAFNQIRRIRPACRVVATTAHYAPDVSYQVGTVGFDGYVEKPFNAPALVPYLQQVVSTVQKAS